MKILPCPFCGGKGEVIDMHTRIMGDYYIVSCDSLGKCEIMPESKGYTKEEAIEMWNRIRVDENGYVICSK